MATASVKNTGYLKTPAIYYGGKTNMLRHIIPMIPQHKSYCEPFFGTGAVFFAKKEVGCEMINDLNDNVINFFKIYQSRASELYEKFVKFSLLSRRQHEKARNIYQNPDKFDELERAWAFWFLANTAFNADMYGNIKFSKNHERSFQWIKNSKLNFIDPAVIRRIEKTQIDCRDALRVIYMMDSKVCFHYIDPPYLNADQGHYAGYTETDFINLLNECCKLKGKFLLSCYPGEIIKEYAAQNKWQYRELTIKSSASNWKPLKGGHSKNRDLKRIQSYKTEVLCWNYEIPNKTLFCE